jgi:hypothetical protein
VKGESQSQVAGRLNDQVDRLNVNGFDARKPASLPSN